MESIVGEYLETIPTSIQVILIHSFSFVAAKNRINRVLCAPPVEEIGNW